MKLDFNILKNFIPNIKKITKTPNNVQQVVNKANNINNNKPLFCVEYWKDARKEGLIKPTNQTSVSLHGNLNGINHHFIHSPEPNDMNIKSFGMPATPREIITQTDREFKSLAPLEKDLHTYRCIPPKPEFFAEYPQFMKSKSIKNGDTIIMREYAYATSDPSYAKVYLGNDGGIMYDIKVGKGAKVSRKGDIGNQDEIVFPRSSRFKCIKTEEVKEEDRNYLKVFLEYIIPDESNILEILNNKI